MWGILRERNIQFKDETYKRFSCVICKNILIEPRLAPCTCRFCWNCINHYLQDGDKMCPGSSDDCNLDPLTLIDIVVDHVSIKGISLLTVICPEENCNLEFQLKNLNGHLQMCENSKSACLFHDLGCGETKISKEETLEHFTSFNEVHSKLMLDLINNIKNEMKEIEKKNRAEIESTKQEVVDSRETLHQTLDSFVRYQNEMDEMKENLRRKDEEISTMKQNFEKEIRELRQRNKKQDENVDMKKALSQLEEENRILQRKVDQIIRDQQNMKGEIDKSTKSLSVQLLLMDMKIFNIENTFVWKISNLSQYKGKNSIIWSDYFYDSEGHKLCLTFYPDGFGDIQVSHVSVELCMSKFQCHEAKSFNGNVIIEIINQITGAVHKSSQKNCKIDISSSTTPFNFYSSDISVQNALKDNSIILRCCLKLL